MDSEQKKNDEEEGVSTRAKYREVAAAIVKEAEECALPEDSQENDEISKKVQESEKKRLLLAEALHASRLEIQRLMPGRDRDADRALPFGVFVQYGPDYNAVIIKYHGRLHEAKVLTPEPEAEEKPAKGTFHALRQTGKEKRLSRRSFRKGELLLLNNELQVLEQRGFELICGGLATVQQILTNEKLLVKTVGDESLVVTRAEPLSSVKILIGDKIEYDHESLFAYGLLPKGEVDRLTLEKVPDIHYSDIGGLDEAIELIRDAIELPNLYPEYFKEHRLVPPKGILLYGPPGCGKTLLAKAVANSLAKRIEEETGERKAGFFLNVKGPELLNKYVGETEQAIRDLFARARNQARHRTPVIIFFDEMDSMFRVRGSGISSDMEATIVPQFLAELDGLEPLENVVIIGATNREDLIDPAVLRPGRLDRKIRIPRPDRNAALEIFAKYLAPDLPLDPLIVEQCGDQVSAVDWLISTIVDDLYNPKPENELMEITYADGTHMILYLKDFVSGAIIEHIVNRAKLFAVKDLVNRGIKGITLDHLLRALRREFEENEDLPSNTNPAEWYRIIGRGGERVVRIRSLSRDKNAVCEEQKPVETVEVTESLK
ncbi:MAG: proteasome ATPase [Desulfomonile tiedjei]|uniref:Proteasome ATPase n=1 Tax=Desulfomonile tiedjei TaxID=2358 RepID=A0A9D6UYU7_9BACT|nr:proteasome ATPase [Desulfomonile tiedjei]